MVTEVYSGSEILTDSWILGILAVLFSEGSAQHYFLVLKEGKKIIKLEWGPDTKKTIQNVKGKVATSDLSRVPLSKIGETDESINNIVKIAKKRWKGKMYNSGGKNCIAFSCDICKQLGLTFSSPFLE